MSDVDVILELPQAWFVNPVDGDRHRMLYTSIWLALGELGVSVRPIILPFGADDTPRLYDPTQLVLSYHSRGAIGNVLRIKESYLPPYYTIDRMGYSGFSELAQFPMRFADSVNSIDDLAAAAFVQELRSKTRDTNTSKYSQPQTLAETLPENFIFQPLQTIDDPVAGLAWFDQFDVLGATASAAQLMGWSVVFKRHPLCKADGVTRRLEHLQTCHPNLIRSNASIHHLISGSQAVIGANSGVLFEAILHGAHVISFGNSDFILATTKLGKLGEIPSFILGRGRINRSIQCRFLTWYLQQYCVAADDVAAICARVADALGGRALRSCERHRHQAELFNQFAQKEHARRRSMIAKFNSTEASQQNDTRITP